LARGGHIGRSAKALLQEDLPPITGATIASLKKLHPVNPMMVRLIKGKMANGAAPGPSGWTGELLEALTDDPDWVRCVCILIEDIINGNLRSDARSYLVASTLHPIPKSEGGIRPIAVGEVWYKLAASYVMDSVRDSFPALFEPIQMGVGCPGGAEKAANVLRAGLEIYGTSYSNVISAMPSTNANGTKFSIWWWDCARCELHEGHISTAIWAGSSDLRRILQMALCLLTQASSRWCSSGR